MLKVVECEQNSRRSNSPCDVTSEYGPPLSSPIRVLLVSDNPIFRAGIRSCLAGCPDILIVAEVGSDAATSRPPTAKQSDVAIVDMVLRDGDGITASLGLRAQNPEIKIVLMSDRFDPRAICRGLKANVEGFLLKSDHLASWPRAIRDVSSDRRYRSDALDGCLCFDPDGNLTLAEAARCCGDLSPRERAILILLSDGASLKQVAHRMGISYKAADHAKQALMRKFRVHDRVQLTRIALQEGLIP